MDTLFGVLALPKLCLLLVPTKGRFSLTDLEMAVLRRLGLFRQGLWQELWNELQAEEKHRHGIIETRAAKKARSTPNVADARVLHRTRLLVGDGAAAKAVQSLASAGIHQASNPAVLQQLRELHPAGRPVSDPHLPT